VSAGNRANAAAHAATYRTQCRSPTAPWTGGAAPIAAAAAAADSVACSVRSGAANRASAA
jgi:hypothetical protein